MATDRIRSSSNFNYLCGGVDVQCLLRGAADADERRAGHAHRVQHLDGGLYEKGRSDFLVKVEAASDRWPRPQRHPDGGM